jgi:hypothetical protein
MRDAATDVGGLMQTEDNVCKLSGSREDLAALRPVVFRLKVLER